MNIPDVCRLPDVRVHQVLVQWKAQGHHGVQSHPRQVSATHCQSPQRLHHSTDSWLSRTVTVICHFLNLKWRPNSILKDSFQQQWQWCITFSLAGEDPPPVWRPASNNNNIILSFAGEGPPPSWRTACSNIDRKGNTFSFADEQQMTSFFHHSILKDSLLQQWHHSFICRWRSTSILKDSLQQHRQKRHRFFICWWTTMTSFFHHSILKDSLQQHWQKRHHFLIGFWRSTSIQKDHLHPEGQLAATSTEEASLFRWLLKICLPLEGQLLTALTSYSPLADVHYPGGWPWAAVTLLRSFLIHHWNVHHSEVKVDLKQWCKCHLPFLTTTKRSTVPEGSENSDCAMFLA